MPFYRRGRIGRIPIWIIQQHTSAVGGGGCEREGRRKDESRGGDGRDEGPSMDTVERSIAWGGDLVEAKFLPPHGCDLLF